MKNKTEEDIPRGTECTYCGHTYIFPCNGERYECQNAVHVRAVGKKAKHVPEITKAKKKRVRL